jgi:hypothetical protein
MAILLSPPRQKVEYKKPRRLNVVSGTMALVLGALIYVGVALWPLATLRSNVKSELSEALPHLWKINLLPEGRARPEIVKLKKLITEQLRKTGIKDDKFELVMARDKQRVALEARYTAAAVFPWSQRKLVLRFSPRVETDAARVDW